MTEIAAGGEALQPTVTTIEEARKVLESAGMSVMSPDELAAMQQAASMTDRKAFVESSIAYHDRENAVLREKRAGQEAKLERERASTAATEQGIEDLDAEIQQNEDAIEALRSELEQLSSEDGA